MKYTIDFTEEKACCLGIELYDAFNRSEQCFSEGDIHRNIRNACKFTALLDSLKIFGVDVECGIYDDNGFDRIGYGRIGTVEIVKNAKLDYIAVLFALKKLSAENK